MTPFAAHPDMIYSKHQCDHLEDVNTVKSSTFLQRLIWFTLIVSTLPVAIIGIFSYFKSSSDIQDKVNDGNMMRLKQTQMTVEQALKTVEHSAVRFANSSLVNANIDMSLTAHQFHVVDDIMKELSTLSGVQLEAIDPLLLSIHKDWAVSEDGLGPMSQQISQDELQYYLQRPEQSFWISEADEPFPGSQPGHINLVVKVPIHYGQPYGLLIIRTTAREINRYIYTSQRIGNVVVLDEQSRVLASETELRTGANAQPAPFMERLLSRSDTSGYFEDDVSNERSGISYIRSDYNGWSYLSIVSIDEITRESRVIGWVTLIICIVTLIVTSMLSFVGSFRMYRPIRSLYDLSSRITGTSEPPSKGTDEFRVISERIHKLDTNQSQLSDQLDRQVEQLNEFFVLKLLRGEIPRKEIEERLTLFGYSVEWTEKCVLAIQIDTLDGTVYEEKDKDLMLFAMKNIVNELALPDSLHACMVMGHSVVVIWGGSHGSKETFAKQVYERAERIQKEIRHYLRLKVSIGISKVCSAYDQLPQAYRESVEALKYRVMLGHESILFIEDLESGGDKPSYPEQLESRLMDAVKETNVEQAAALLEEWIEEVFKSEMRLDEYQLSMVRLLTQIMRMVHDSGEPLRLMELENKSVIDQLFELNTRGDIQDWFLSSLIVPAIKLLDERRDEKYKSISSEVVRMIHEEYDTDLTLEECASRLDYHPSYIWRILRKEAGISFSEYLGQHRLKVAKTWLEESDMTITEIAERLRYNNAQNFIRYFKKMEGVSPGKYRKEHLNPLTPET